MSQEFSATGRRKTAVARVDMSSGTGEIVVNRRPFDSYFPNEALRMIIRQPLRLTETAAKFDILVNVDGGGQAGQAGASLTAIGQALHNLNGLNASIASATLQQAHVVEDINQNVTQAASLSHSTAMAAEQSNVASVHLRGLSEQLDGLLRQFKV